MLNTHALLQMVVSGLGCRHELLKDGHPEPWRIVCIKCGLYAYVPELRRQEDRNSTPERESSHEEPTAGVVVKPADLQLGRLSEARGSV
jgi:hypothetical protein